MRTKITRTHFAAFLFIGGITMMMSCSTAKYPRLTEPNSAYREGLAPLAPPLPPPGALRPLMALFADYGTENVQAWVRKVYAEELYFRDGFKEITDLDELEEYLVRGTEPLRSCTFDFPAAFQYEDQYYLRWVMKVNLLRDPPDRIEEVIGMSHVRLNPDGKIIFQQDYWDPSDVLYRRIPVAGWLMHKVKASL